MRRAERIMSIISMMCLLVCTSCVNERIVTAQSSNSIRAQLDATIEGNEMTVKLTNLTDHTVEVDGEMEIFFSFDFTVDNSEPKLSKGLGKPLSERMVKLAPGESITKVFRKGDVHHYYQSLTYISEDGKGGVENIMYTYQIPDLTKLIEIDIIYDSRGGDSLLPLSLASAEEDTKSFLDANASLEIKFVKGL